jgi:heat shock protein HslJ
MRTRILLLAALVAGACGPADQGAAAGDRDAPQTEANAPTDPADDSDQPPSLAGTSWRLVEFRSMDDATGTIRPTDPSDFTMELQADGSVAMGLDCNRAAGRWTAQPAPDGPGGRFEFGPLAMTRALCPPPRLDERIAGDAGYVRSYILEGGRLYLNLMADGGTYVWEPMDGAGETSSSAVPAAPEDGGPRAWIVPDGPGGLELRERAAAGATVQARYPAGTLLDNLGCEEAAGEAWCYVQELGGGAVGYVPASRVEPAVSPDGSVATGYDDSAERAGRGDFDATGSVPCAMTAGQPMAECDFAVARAGGGYATVVVQRLDGGERIVYFRMGRPVGISSSEADPAGELQASEEGDLHFVRVGEERYEIPHAVALGG